eukprot:540983-Hanusia_phi.AAC.1
MGQARARPGRRGAGGLTATGPRVMGGQVLAALGSDRIGRCLATVTSTSPRRKLTDSGEAKAETST